MIVAFKDGSDLICQTTLNVKDLISKKGIDMWHHCRHEGKNNGQFAMRVEYDGASEEPSPSEEVKLPE